MAETKKRSTFSQGTQIDMPEDKLDRKKYSYRWLNAEVLAAASDGYEPRGWGIFKDAEGKTIRRGDLILGDMPIDRYREMKDAEDAEKRDQMSLFFEGQAAEEERLTHDFKKKGGKVKFEFTQE
jgi:hypothetical protein